MHNEPMAINGIGGVFIKAHNPKALYAWYESRLGLLPGDQEGIFIVPTEKLFPNFIKVTISPADTRVFTPSNKPSMLTFQVDDLEAVLSGLAAQGVKIEDKIIQNDFGSFAWIQDPEENRIELWEPTPYQNTLINLPEAE